MASKDEYDKVAKDAEAAYIAKGRAGRPVYDAQVLGGVGNSFIDDLANKIRAIESENRAREIARRLSVPGVRIEREDGGAFPVEQISIGDAIRQYIESHSNSGFNELDEVFGTAMRSPQLRQKWGDRASRRGLNFEQILSEAVNSEARRHGSAAAESSIAPGLWQFLTGRARR